MPAKDKLNECFKEGQKGERHKGLKAIELSEERMKGHLNKAMHNFKAMISLQKTGFSDWSASASFYCLYHGLLALLAKEGYESRNQSCTFALIEDMIERGAISLAKEDLKEIFDADVTQDLEHSNKILDIRENMQYSIKTALEQEEFLELKERTKRLFDKIRRNIEGS
ncbi:HEPN domain-containing protein [Candidatus Woesearchaeota archaeon]|nr:HEPN domain-containing protein [Candidatus Woesearchaeota archaeon]